MTSVNTTVLDRGSFYLISLKGSLNGESSPAFEQSMKEMPPKHTIFNMQDLDYISSAGLRVVLVTAKELKKKNMRLLLSNLEPKIKKVFEMAGFLSIIETAQTQDKAVERLGFTLE